MGYKVIIAPRAINDLREIVAHVAADRPAAASRLGYALIDACKPLAAFPFLGQVVPEFEIPALHELLLNPFRIIYRIDQPGLVIGVLRFWHGARGVLRKTDLDSPWSQING